MPLDFTWPELKVLPKNRLIASSYIWLVLVPVASKFLSKLESTLSFVWAGEKITLVTALPFSWKLFYFSAIAFTVGNLVYIWFCPLVIKRYENYSDFILKGGNIEEMDAHLTEQEKEVAFFAKSMGKPKPAYEASPDATQTKDQFWKLYRRAENAHPKTRLAVVMVYGLGFIGFGWVIVSNLIWVVTHVAL